MKKTVSQLAATFVAAVLMVIGSATGASAAPLPEFFAPTAWPTPTTSDPFLCSDIAWTVQGNNGQITTWDLTSNPFTFTTIATLGFIGNSIAYNVNDGLLYLTRGNEHIYTVDAAGVITDRGIPTEVGTGATPNVDTWNAGTFGPDGTYYVTDTGTRRLYRIDVATGTYTSILMDSALDSWDFAWDPVTGLLTTIENGSRVLRTVDPNTGAVTRTQLSGTATGANGAVIIDSSGTLYPYSNPGDLYKVEQPLASGTVTPIASGPGSGNNDGASCTFGAKTYKTVTPSTVQVGDSVTYTFEIFWQGPAISTASLSDTLTFGGVYDPTSLTVNGVSTTTPLGGTATFSGNQMTLSNMNFTTGSTYTISVDVDIPPGATIGDVDNQATIGGLGATYADIPTDFPVTDEVGDVTPLTIVAVPLIANAKSAGTPVANGDGTYNVPYTFVVENIGGTVLNNLTLTDDIAAQIGAGFVAVVGDPVITSTAAAPPAANTSYDPGGTGSLINAVGASLQPGESYTVDIVVTLDPTQLGGTVTNQSTAGGTDPVTNATVTDLSDSGTDPATGNTGEPGDTIDPVTGESGTDDPTPVAIPAIGVAKEATSVVDAASGAVGNVDVTYTMTVANNGSVDLTDVDLTDDIAGQFGGAFVGVTAQPTITANTSTGSATASTSYDGTNSLAAATTLVPGDSFTIQVTVEVNPNGDPATLPLENQATATGDWTSLTGTVGTISDLSDDGTSATGDNGTGGPDDPTPLAVADIGVAKAVGSPTANPDGTFDIPYTFVVANTGSVSLNNLSLVDDFDAQFGAGSIVGVATAPSVSAISGPNSAYTATAADPEMLDGTGTLAPGESFTVTVTVTVDPTLATLPLQNQATAAGVDVDDPTNTATDLSDAGSDPEGTNGSGGSTDPTTIASPSVGVAKAVQSVTPSATTYGNYDVTYRLVLANNGLETIENISLTDDLAAELASGYVGVTTTPTIVSSTATGTVTGNGAYLPSGDTEMLVATGAQLAPGGSIVVDVTVEIDPSAADIPSPLLNQATVTATGVSTGNTATDVSDSGTDPSGTNTGEPGDTGGPDDPTPTAIPSLSATKAATDVTASATAGHIDVTYTMSVQNTGNTDLTNLSLTDDLTATFGGALVSVVSTAVDAAAVTATPTPATNPTAFDGTTNTELLDQLGTLAPGDRLDVTLVVEIDPTAGDGTPFENQATATGIDPAGQPVTDLTDSGTDPTTTNEAAPGATTGGPDDPTPLLIDQIGVAKSATVVGSADTVGNAIVEFTFVVANTGSVTLTPIALTDDLAADLGPAFVAIDSPPTISASTATTDPTVGSGNPDILSGTDGELAPGQSVTITLQVEIDPGAVTTPLTNQATATGDFVDPNGVTQTTTDLSDSGTDPAGGNPGEPGDTVDPVTGESGTDDPTPVAVPLISIAKAVDGTPALPASGTVGNVDVTYSFVVENLGNETLTKIAVADDWAAEFGGAFVGVVTPPQITASTATADPTPATGNPGFFVGTDGELAPGESFTVTMTIEIDPDATGAVLPLENQATASGTDQYGTTVTDDSDSGTDPAGSNEGEPGATPDSATDPTPLYLPAIAAAKDVSSPTPTANAGEFEVTYTLVVQNVGSETLTNLSLTDDLATELGDAFGSVTSASVTNIDADVAPGANAGFDGSADTELLDGTGTLKPGQSFTVAMTVLLTPFAGTATFPLTNQASAAGTWTNPETGATAEVTDLSDAGGSATTDNGEGGTADPTAIINPDIRVAKAVTDVASNADGTATVTYQYVVQNFGFVDLYGVSLSDDIVNQLGGTAVVTSVGTPTVISQPSGSAIAPNAAFDGAAEPNLISDPSTAATDDGLAPGATFTVTVEVIVDPTTATSPMLNQATATGTDSGGVVATDLSDSGTDPQTTNGGAPNDSGGSDDPTPLQLPGISVAKAVTDAAATGTPGVYDITYTLVAANTGSETLTNLGLTEDLAATFGGALVGTPTATVTNIDADVPPGASTTFNGVADTELLDGNGSLAPGQSYSVTVTVTIDATADPAALPFDNSVEATGDWTDVDGVVATTTDISDSGTDPNSSNEGAPGSTPGSTVDPTPLTLPALAVAKAVTDTVPHPGGPVGHYDVTYTFEVANVGTQTIADLTLTDDLAAQLSGGLIGTVAGPTVTNGTVDPATDLPTPGTGAPDLLGGDGSIDPGEAFRVSITVQVDAAALTPDVTNSAVVAGVDPTDPGTPIVDTSDSGTDPTTGNPDGIGNTTDPITGEPSTGDPTPLILPNISVTKAATVIGPAATGVPSNYDVQFNYVVANTGNQVLTNLSLIDDLATELGGAFVQVSMPVSVASISAPNTAFDGSADTEMLDRSGTLAPGESFTVSVLVEVKPSAGDSPLLNQATAAGDWADPYGNTGTVDDLSDSGTDPTTGNTGEPGDTVDPTTGESGVDDPTPISIADISVAKNVAEVVNPASSGTYGNMDVRYQFVVANIGNEPLTTVSLTDDLTAQLTSTFVGVVTPPAVTVESLATDPVADTTYDGSATLATAAEMLPGESFTVEVVVEIDPDAAALTEVQFNQATVAGTDPDGTPVTDLSDSGTDPGTANPGEPNDSGGSDDPTPLVAPAINVAKSSTVVGPATSGTAGNYDVTFTYDVANTGNTMLVTPVLADDFATQFGAAFVGVVDPGVNVSAIGAANPNFDGTTDTDLLDTTNLSGFSPGQTFTVTVTVEIDASEAPIPFVNQATVGATWVDPDNNTGPVTDLSDSGTDATTTNEGAPGSTTNGGDDPTPVAIPALAVAKSAGTVVPAASGTVGNVDVTYQFVVSNTGTVTLPNVDLADELATQLGTAFVAVTTAPAIVSSDAAVDPTPNAAYAGSGSLASGATLDPQQTYTISIVVEIDPSAATTTLTNQATVSAPDPTNPDGDPVTDLSDSGSDPASGNAGAPGDTVDPVTGVSGVDDPTPLVVPQLSLAKSSTLVGPAASGVVGHYDVAFTVVVANTGNIDLTNLSVVDDLATELGSVFVGVVGAPTVSAISGPNAGFDGSADTELLDRTGTLAPGGTFEITFTAELNPFAAPPPLENQATGAGDWDAGTSGSGTVTDLSDSGTDPTGSNEGAPGSTTGGTDDPTPISLGLIGVAKKVSAVTDPAASGTYGNVDVTYEFVVANNGTVTLTGVELIDDLATQLGDAFVGVTTAPAVIASTAATSPTPQAGYDGTAALATGGVLGVGEQFAVQVTVEVDPAAAAGPLTNQATANGTDPDGVGVTDLSDSGTDPATGNTGEPGDNVNPDTGVSGVDDPTPLIVPKIAVTKAASLVGPAASGTAGNFDVEFTFDVANTGSVALTNPSLTDDLATQLGAAFVGVTSAPAVSAISGPNTAFDGSTNTELLDGTGTLAIGASFTVTVVVEITPGADALTNQATATGTDPDGTAVTDLSDSGTDPATTNEDAPGATTDNPDDPTPITLSAIAVAKSVATVTSPAASGAYGNVDVTYEFVVANNGNTTLTDIGVSDDLATQFGAAFVGVTTQPAISGSTATTDPTPDAYTGAASLVSGGVLDPGQSVTITVTVEIDPSAADGPLDNQATATGTDPSGTPVTDLSDSGTNPASGNTGEPGDTVDPVTGVSGVDDPTPLTVPQVAVTKAASVVGPASSGTPGNYDIEFTFNVANTGNIDLTSPSLTDDLATQLGAAFVGVTSAPVVSAISGPNTAFDGSTNTELLDGTGTLAVGASFTVTVVAEIKPGTNPLTNQATATGTDPDGTTVTDLSDSGTDPTTTNENAPGATTNDPNDPTPIAVPVVAVVKAATNVTSPAASGNVGDVDVTYEFVVANNGNTTLTDVELTDDLATQFGPAYIGVVTQPKVTDSTAATDPTPVQYTGAGTLVSGGVLNPGQSFTVAVTVEIDPSAADGALLNQATATGVDPDGTKVEDLSDSGTDPATGNPGEPGDTVDPVTGTSGVDNPTPVIVAQLGVAKSSELVGPASSGTVGNYDVEYTFNVANTGNIDLTNPSLTDDLATQLGDVFVGVVSAPVVSAISGPNTAFDGSADTELLDGTGTIAVGDTFTVTVVVEVDATTGTVPITNQATATGDWADDYGRTGTASDLSDSGTDPTTTNPDAPGATIGTDGKPNPDDPTPLALPLVAITKAVGTVTPAANDQFDVTFRLKVANTGTVDLTSMSVEDDLATQFGPAFVEVISARSSTFTISTSYDGKSDIELLAAGNTLKVGDTNTIVMVVRVDPDAKDAPNPLLNQAVASGADVDDPTSTATDRSDSGVNPATTNNNAPGATPDDPDDPTPVQLPALAVDKFFLSATDLGDGTQKLTYRIKVTNTGNTPLTDVVAYDDVQTQFAAANLVAGSEVATDGTGTANTAWDGSAASNVFAPGQSIAVGKSLTVEVSFAVAPTTSDRVANAVSATATGPNGPLDPETDTATKLIETTYGSIGGIVFLDLNKDGLKDPSDTGIAGVTVTLLDADGKVVATTTTDPDGNYTFDDVPPGDYTVVETQPDGYGSSTASKLPVSVASGGEATADFGDTGGELSGRLWIDANGDGIYQPTEQPAPAGTVVNLYDTDGNLVATTTSDADGNYSFPGLPVGEYTVEVEQPDGYAFTIESSADSGSDLDPSDGTSGPISIGLDDCTDPSEPGCGPADAEVDGGLVAGKVDVGAVITVPPTVPGADTAVIKVTPTNDSTVPLPDGVTYTVTVPACATVIKVDAPGYEVTIVNGVVTLVWPNPLAPGEDPPPFDIITQVVNADTTCQVTASVGVNGSDDEPVDISVPLMTIKKRPGPVTGGGFGSTGSLALTMLLTGVGLVALSRRRRAARPAT